jgi:hypothetical protein
MNVQKKKEMKKSARKILGEREGSHVFLSAV